MQTYVMQLIRLFPVFFSAEKNLMSLLGFRNTHLLRKKPGLSKRLIICVLFLALFSFLACCLECRPAGAFNAVVMPHEVKQGDAFFIRVTDIYTYDPPVAFLGKKRFSFSSCGESCFVAVGAIEMGTRPGTYTVNLSVNEQEITLTIFVKPSHFPTLSLTLPDEKVFLSEENLKRVKEEEKKLSSLFQVVSEKLWEGGFILPLDNEFSTVFGAKRIMNKKRISIHRGLDIRGKTGETVSAANHGRVILAEELFFGGNTVIIDHGQGIYSIYMHLSSMDVLPGHIISKGDKVGSVGASGRTTGPHLHFGVKVLQVDTNPLSMVALDLY